MVLLAATTLASAQTPVAPAAPAKPAPLLRPNEVTGGYGPYLSQRYASDREARAVIHLFSRKRLGGGLWLLSGAAAIGYVSSQTGTTTSGSGTRTVTVTPLGYGILAGLFGGIGVGKLVRFSNQKLFDALLAHEQSGGFPEYVTNKLKDKDYK